jgi:hypothetical protein
MQKPEVDPSTLEEAIRLTKRIYRLHETGQPYASEVLLLSKLTTIEVTTSDACGAFGSISEEEWALGLLLQAIPFPEQLTRDDMIDMIARVCDGSDPEWACWYIDCVAHATGCPDVSDIIYYPGRYFGDDAHENVKASEIVDAAMKHPRRVLVTPPPASE